GGCSLASEVVADFADHLALMHGPTAEDAVLIEVLREHVQVAEADMLVRRVGHDVNGSLARRAQHHAVAHCNDVMLVGFAAVGAWTALLAGTRADVLTLMAEAARALPDPEETVLAEIVAPGIGVVRGLVRDQRHAVDAAAIGGGVAAPAHRHAAGLVAVAP